MDSNGVIERGGLMDTGWRFDNSYARLPASLHAPALPSPAAAARVVLLNEPLAVEMGLDPDRLRESLTALLSGKGPPPGAEPIAQAYAGHQFGHFTNLGDGRAILLGEQMTPDGRRLDVHLKGSGRTRYSRGGDGKAALGPMLREYLVSEGMHALGIPTTRSLAVIATGQEVLRTTPLAGAVLVRVAASHIRVGTFEFAAAIGDRDALAALLDHAILRHAPEAVRADDPAVAFFEAVAERQAALVARWMLVGFVHGVMNTDNMAVSGETIDYGPCAFLDTYSPEAVFSSIDHAGRYAFGSQPAIAHWNLARLAESLMPLVSGDEQTVLRKLRDVYGTFPERYERHLLAGARRKLGLATEEQGDRALYESLLARMHAAEADFTSSFAALARLAEPPQPAEAGSPSRDALPPPAGGQPANPPEEWLAGWRQRLSRQPQPSSEAAAGMRAANPILIPRNHRVEESLAAAEGGDLTLLERLLEALRRPFAPTAGDEPYRHGPPPGCGPYRTFCGT
jgi:uncharacterized protein YdiU (UPF0061 family)